MQQGLDPAAALEADQTRIKVVGGWSVQRLKQHRHNPKWQQIQRNGRRRQRAASLALNEGVDVRRAETVVRLKWPSLATERGRGRRLCETGENDYWR